MKNGYNFSARSARATQDGFFTKSREEVFTQRGVHPLMSPIGLQFRECFDSDKFPEALPGIIGLDVTASMGHIPHEIIKNGLPTMMGALTERGLPYAQICFAAIGDDRRDRGPLQVGQFETGDVELDTWLQKMWLEGGGGGNNGESYSLAWYFGAKHTKTHAWEKRRQKGFIFTIGDEPCHADISTNSIKGIFGEQEPIEATLNSKAILKLAQERYYVYHIAVGDMEDQAGWRDLLGENYIQLADYTRVGNVIADKMLEVVGGKTVSTPVSTPVSSSVADEEML